MDSDVLNCCNTELSIKNLGHHQFIDCFKTSNKFFKKKTTDKRLIVKEIVLLAICPQCKHYVLKYLWYTRKASRFFDYDETKTYRGKRADEIFTKRCEDYEPYKIPNPYKTEENIKHSKSIPWIYGKTLSDTIQIPRYYNETGNAGRKIYSKINTCS